MDAYRDKDTFMVRLDLPGVDADSIDLTVEQNVLTVHAERRRPAADDVERIAGECSYGVFSRQLFLGDSLDVDRVQAEYTDGVLTLRVPVAEQAKPRRIEIGRGASDGEAPHQITGKVASKVTSKAS